MDGKEVKVLGFYGKGHKDHIRVQMGDYQLGQLVALPDPCEPLYFIIEARPHSILLDRPTSTVLHFGSKIEVHEDRQDLSKLFWSE